MVLAGAVRLPPPPYVAPPLVLAALVLCAACSSSALRSRAHRWFIVPPGQFQPSELAKLSLCRLRCDVPRPAQGRRGRSASSSAARRPDADLRGADRRRARPRNHDHALRMMADELAIFLVAGVPIRLLVGAARSSVGLGLLAIWIEPYRRARIFSFPRSLVGRAGRGSRSSRRRSASASGGSRAGGARGGRGEGSYLPKRIRTYLRGHRRGAGLIGATFVIACVRAARDRGLPHRAALPGSLRKAPSRPGSRRSSAGRPRSTSQRRSASLPSPGSRAVRLLRRSEPRGLAHRDGGSP